MSAAEARRPATSQSSAADPRTRVRGSPSGGRNGSALWCRSRDQSDCSGSLRAEDPEDPTGSAVLALVEDAFARLLDEPETREHVAGFASGDVAFVVTRDGVEVRRRTGRNASVPDADIEDSLPDAELEVACDGLTRPTEGPVGFIGPIAIRVIGPTLPEHGAQLARAHVVAWARRAPKMRVAELSARRSASGGVCGVQTDPRCGSQQIVVSRRHEVG